ncbi:MAG: hypothetical protein HYX94_05500 [Chloroflexi bacterium]|nr:hypothetical protein [Chloroflexota bacterium]
MARNFIAASPSPRKLGLQIFWFFLFLYLLTANGRIVNRDGEAVFQVARSIAERGSFDVPGESVFETSVGPRGTEGHSLSFATETAKRGTDGRVYSMYGLGQSLVTIPFYYAGKLMAFAAPSVDPYFTTRFATTMLNPVISALACAVLFAYASSLGFGLRASLVAALIYGLATMAWPYAKSYFGEPLAGLLLVASALCLVRSSPSPKPLMWSALAGVALGFAVMARVSTGVLLPVFVLYWLAIVRERGIIGSRHVGCDTTTGNEGRGILSSLPSALKSALLQSALTLTLSHPAEGRERGLFPLPPQWERVRVRAPQRVEILRLALEAGAFFLPLAAILALIGWYNFARFGSPFVTGYESIAWNRLFVEGLYGLLLSPGKGLIWYSPVLIISLIVSVAFFRWRKREALFFAGLGLVWLLFHAPYRFWEGGWSWGPRLMLPVLPFLVLVIGALYRTQGLPQRVGRRLLPVAVALGLIVQVSAVGVDYTRYLLVAFTNDPDGMYERVIFQPAGSPLVGQWTSLAAVLANAAGPGELAKVGGDFAAERARLDTEGRSEAERSVEVLEETQLAGLNFPDFWFVYLYLFQGSRELALLAALALLGATGAMLMVLNRRLRELAQKERLG